ncbi:hypothetical protein AUR04nite_11270 [Glutamicibacter uratoxydans]|uniref:Uncharacterized protein n=1 Tax=Glutamicibacter uratoxydans TaxID=43667 RepID=A0A4Y4DPS0_GLUUR|nr:hypothetical protein [Glutamicibacter uratoxydans]GED05595.1 hypothetical protein AUR04nite_11270 [Glutamicibacter uratoxydans]
MATPGVEKTLAFAEFDTTLMSAPKDSPWILNGAVTDEFNPSYQVLERLLSIPVRSKAATRSGRFAQGVDTWLAHELRRAGFDADLVWPRTEAPRVLSKDILELLRKLPERLSEEVHDAIVAGKAGSTDARILGRAYMKQTDVVMTHWSTGPELLLSTKAMTSSFGKNLSNRYEEAYGDAANLRARYPLAAVGFFFVQRATILDSEPAAFRRTVDMIRKLRDFGDGFGYTATGLLLVDWDEDVEDPAVRCVHGPVPQDIAAPQFLNAMVDEVLKVTPIDLHEAARARRAGEVAPLPSHEAVDEQQEALF